MARRSSRNDSIEPQPGLRFRAPGATLGLGELLRRALPETTPQQRSALLRGGGVTVAGVRQQRDAAVAAGGEVEVASPLRPIERVLAPLAAAGYLRALVLALPWPSGQLEQPGVPESGLRFAEVERRGVAAELSIELAGAAPLGVLEQFARIGHPLIGDCWHAGVLAEGGLRLRSEDAPPPANWWPNEPLLLGRSPRAGGQPPVLQISSETRSALARGHPWVLRDADTGDPQCYRPGALVRLETPQGRAAGLALIDGEGERVARCWSAAKAAPARVEQRVHEAFERRAALLTSGDGDALRLVHGEADGLPGLAIDRLGSLLRVLVHGRSALSISQPAREAAARELFARTGCDPAVLEVMHLRRPARARLECARLVRGEVASLGLDAHGRFPVRERGLRFAVDPGLAEPERSAPGVGLFLDQRDNRSRLAERVQAADGGRWLNLFAHTGAFSVALLAAGAREVVSVDLSARYLRWLEQNLELNRDLGVDPGHHTGVRRDGRRFLAELAAGERFSGILLDPPTAAAAGSHYWSIRKDLQPLIEVSLEHLEPGGWLLVARNDRAGRGPSLRTAVEAACERTRVGVRSVEAALPGADFPSLRGFPEGDPFRALLLQREGGA